MVIGYGQNMWRLNTVAWCKYYWSFLHIIIYMTKSYIWLKYKCDFEDHCFNIHFLHLVFLIGSSNSWKFLQFSRYRWIQSVHNNIPCYAYTIFNFPLDKHSIYFKVFPYFFLFFCNAFISACSICFSKSYL